MKTILKVIWGIFAVIGILSVILFINLRQKYGNFRLTVHPGLFPAGHVVRRGCGLLAEARQCHRPVGVYEGRRHLLQKNGKIAMTLYHGSNVAIQTLHKL